MPNYTFKSSDGTIITKRLTFAEYNSVVAGEMKVVDVNDQDLELVFDPGVLNLTFKDGESGGWASKAEKEKKYRAARRVTMTQRERDHVFKPRLVPNYGGQEAHSWADVRDHARTVKGEASAATYDRHVAAEVRRGIR